MKQSKNKHLAECQQNLRIKELVKIVKVKNEGNGLLLLQDNCCGNSTITQYKSKGPPGIRPSPGGIYCPQRGHPPEALKPPPEPGPERCPEFIEGLVEGEIIKKEINYHIKQRIITQLNFTIMKKQNFILVLIVLTLIVGFNKSYAQTLPDLTGTTIFCPTPTPVVATCVKSDELHPVAGTQYTYKVTVNDPASTINWFVTTDPDFIKAGVLTTNIQDKASSAFIISAGVAAGSAVYNSGTNTINQIDITWKSFDPATNNVFLVTYVENSTGCTDNIQVYKIEPVQSFTLDIAALTAAGATNSVKSDCVSPVVTAKYDATLNAGAGGIVADYGQNYIFFAVNAANFSHSWKPSFQLTTDLSATTSPSTTLAVDWAYSATPTVWTNAPVDATDKTLYVSNTAVNAVNGIGAGASGECIIVRVTVDHNTDETLADINLKLAVDGVMYDPKNSNYADLTKGDIHFDKGSGAGENCPWVDGFKNDFVDYKLTHRPTVTTNTGTPVLNFIPKN